MVVPGPWPGRTLVSSGRARSREWIESMIWSKLPPGRSVRPMLPANERIAGHQQLERSKVQAHRPLGMAGGVQDLGGVVLQSHDLAIRQASVGRSHLRRMHPDPRRLRIHHFEQWQIVLVEINGRARQLLELQRPAHVVDMRVGYDDLLELEPQFGEPLMNARRLVTGIDDDGLPGLFIAQDGAVAGQRPDGKGLQDHGFDCRAAPRRRRSVLVPERYASASFAC